MADVAYEFVRDAAANDAVILFVGTKSKLLMLLKKKQNVLVNTTSTTVGWVELLQTGILSKTYRSFERNQTHGRRWNF